MKKPLRLAHISDLHFSRFSPNPLQLFSKRWLGTLNLALIRKNEFLNMRPYELIDTFKDLNINEVIISGDVSTTSYAKEFIMAKGFTKSLGLPHYVIPGNHDHYTRASFRKKLFYSYFPSKFSDMSPFDLKNDRLTMHRLTDGWTMIALDTALATPLYASTGLFSPEIEAKLEDALKQVPPNDRVILVNHFPFFQHESPRRILKRGRVLEALIKRHPQISLYLHGHTHRHCLADLRGDGLPIVLDSGSCSHYQRGSWNLLELSPNRCAVEVYRWNTGFKKSHEEIFTWD